MLKIQNKSQWFKKIVFATLAVSVLNACGRSEERRVGKECAA